MRQVWARIRLTCRHCSCAAKCPSPATVGRRPASRPDLLRPGGFSPPPFFPSRIKMCHCSGNTHSSHDALVATASCSQTSFPEVRTHFPASNAIIDFWWFWTPPFHKQELNGIKGLGSTCLQVDLTLLSCTTPCWMVLGSRTKFCGAEEETSLFSTHELQTLRETLVEFWCDQGYSCSTAVPAYQPCLLEAWRALSTAVKDIDESLPHILLEGVLTGILSPIPHSGAWGRSCWGVPFASSYTAMEKRTRWPQASKITLDARWWCWFCLHLDRGFRSGQQHWGEKAAGRKAMEASVARTAGASFKSGRGCLVCMACQDFCQCVREGLNEVSKGLDALL